MISIQKHIISEAFEQLSKSAKLNESKLVENDKLDVKKLTPKDVEEMKKSIRNPKGLSLPQIQNLQQTIREYNKLHDKQLKKDLDEDIISSDVLPDISTTFSKWLSDEYGLELDDLTDDEYKEYKDEYNRTMKMVRKTYYSESKLIEKILDKDVYTIGIYGDEIPGFKSLDSFLDHLESKGLTIVDSDGDIEYGWETTISGPGKILYDTINNKVPGYNCSTLEDFIEQYSLEDFDDTIEADWTDTTEVDFDESLKKSKLTEAPMDVKDYAAKLKARKAEKSQNPLEKIKSQLTPDMSISDQLQVYFDELVPARGPAETVAGELVRAIMRILYRDYNDGDLWYTGYGKETCGDSVVYLVEHIEDLESMFNAMIYYEMEGTEYTDALEDVASEVMLYLNKHPELFTTPLDKDSRSGADLESYFDLPTYEFEPDTSYDEDYYDVSWDDIDEYINDVVNADFRGATVNRWARDGWTIEGLDKEQLEYLEDVWEKWFNDFLSEHEREEEPEEDYEDEVAEADWDDSTDSEFDESLKESADKVFVVKSTSHHPFNGWIELMDKLDKNGEGEKHKFTDQKQLNDFAKTLIKQGYKNYQGYPLKESLNKDNQKRGRKMKIVAEDFQECNLNKMGTNEYEANTNRQKHINMYRKFANLNEDEVITEDMIDDLALTKTATYCNREPDRIRAEILGQRYSEYEQ